MISGAAEVCAGLGVPDSRGSFPKTDKDFIAAELESPTGAIMVRVSTDDWKRCAGAVFLHDCFNKVNYSFLHGKQSRVLLLFRAL